MFEKMKERAVGFCGKVSYKARLYAPEINLGIGLVCFVGTVVTASKAALEVDDILSAHKERLGWIHEGMEVDDEYKNGGAAKRDLIRAYSATAVDFAKHYALSAALGALSVGFIIESHNILSKRYLSASAAYTALSEVFHDYRGRVREEMGVDMDRHFRYGTDITEVKERVVDEDGKKTTKTMKVEDLDPNNIKPSDIAVVFDETNDNWDPNPSFNLQWLKARENYVNDLFISRKSTGGVVLLNEVYDALGFPPTQEGAVLGWVWGMGDNRIDFGLYNLDLPGVRRFINGQDNFVLLDFNVDGIVWNRLPSRKDLTF